MSLYRVRVKDYARPATDTDFYTLAESVMRAAQAVRRRIERDDAKDSIIVSIVFVSDDVVVDTVEPSECEWAGP